MLLYIHIHCCYRLSQSSSDSDDHDDNETTIPKPQHMQTNQPRLNLQEQNSSHMTYSGKEVDNDVIEDEQQIEPSDLVWNSNSMYDRLEPLDDEKPITAEDQITAPHINSSAAVHSQIKSRFASAESGGSRIKSPEVTKPPPLHQVLTPPPPPPPPPKIPCGQFVAPPHSPQVALTDPAQPQHYPSTGDLLESTTGVNERAIDCNNDHVIRRTHPPKPENIATRNAIMAWMMEQQSKYAQPISMPNMVIVY